LNGEDSDQLDLESEHDSVSSASVEQDVTQPSPEDAQVKRSRKRKRANAEDDNLEDKYLTKLAQEEAHERHERHERAASNESNSASSESDNEDFVPPQHESVSKPADDPDLEKASRTVFVGNVSSEAISSKSAKKTLLKHLSSFLESLPKADPPHKVESLRFRSTAYGTKLPRKAAFAKKDLMDSTAKSTNAYAVYSTKLACREAAKKLNGTVVLNRHIRVDQIAHPSAIDHRRCVFVGNLSFVDDISQMQDASGDDTQKKQKKKDPADIEEGLWRQFGKAGTIESVRVVRDSKTRVGKGFAYVQFSHENGVEAALLFNDKKYPPLLPRMLRVVRAKKIKRSSKPTNSQAPTSGRGKPVDGRARKLLGKASAAQLNRTKPNGSKKPKLENMTPPEAFVFEGHRAKSSQGNTGLKLGGSGKRTKKPSNRSAKRAAAWKASKEQSKSKA
jgi:nucleolar protein 12